MKTGRAYFVDHNTRTTTWDDPRAPKPTFSSPQSDNSATAHMPTDSLQSRCEISRFGPLTSADLRMMERMIEQREPFAHGDLGLAALKDALKSGRFRTLDDYTTFSGALTVCDLDLIDSGTPTWVLSVIQDLDRKAEITNV